MRTLPPLATCVRDRCLDCPVREVVHCHFRIWDFLRFMAIALPGLLLGALAIRMYQRQWLVPWVVACAAFFGLVEIRVLCSHCPHYAQPGRVLRCWADYGSPKLWRYRPGPLSRVERLVLLSGFAAIWGFPLGTALVGRDFVLVGAMVVAIAGFYAALRRRFCSRCMNFACPLNVVPQQARDDFLAVNPSVSQGRK